MSDEDRVSTVSSPKTKTETGEFQDQDRDWRVPRPRPRPRLWGSKTETETKTCKNGSRDVSRPRLKSWELQVRVIVWRSLGNCFSTTKRQKLKTRTIRSIRHYHTDTNSVFVYWLTSSTPAGPNCCCSKGSAPYWSNPPFLIFDILALWRSVLSARVPECQKLKIVG